MGGVDAEGIGMLALFVSWRFLLVVGIWIEERRGEERSGGTSFGLFHFDGLRLPTIMEEGRKGGWGREC